MPRQPRADIEVILGGYTELAVSRRDRRHAGKLAVTAATPSSWTTRSISGDGTTDTGVALRPRCRGRNRQRRPQGGSTTLATPSSTRSMLFFSGDFGRIELGREDGAKDVMCVGGEDAQSGTGGSTATPQPVERHRSPNPATPTRRPTSRRVRRLPARRQLHAGVSETAGRDGPGIDGGQPRTSPAAASTGWARSARRPDAERGRRVRRGRGRLRDDRTDYAAGGLLGVGGLSRSARPGARRPTSTAEANLHLGLEVRLRRCQRQPRLQLCRRRRVRRHPARLRGQRRRRPRARPQAARATCLQHRGSRAN